MKMYETEFKQNVIAKMLQPNSRSLSSISEELDIPKDTLYYWMRQAKNGKMSSKRHRGKTPNLIEKQKLVLESKGLSEDKLGLWLREKGLHESALKAWEQEIVKFLELSAGQSERESSIQKENAKLKKELLRKDKALAEMTALVVLKKKLLALFGEEDDQ